MIEGEDDEEIEYDEGVGEVDEIKEEMNNSHEDKICERCKENIGINDYNGNLLCSDCIEHKKRKKRKNKKWKGAYQEQQAEDYEKEEKKAKRTMNISSDENNEEEKVPDRKLRNNESKCY